MKNTKEKNRRKSDGFISGVLILSLCTVVVKVIGLAFKIPLMSLLGAEGMGYFNSAYEIYAVLCVLATAGLPTALSVLVSASMERGRNPRGIFRSARRLFLWIGAVGSFLLFLLSDKWAELIGNPEASYAVRAISPAFIFVCLASSLRGYFQGQSRMSPTAVSQLIEALTKLILGIAFASVAIKRGFSIYISAAFSILGISVGTLLSALFLFAIDLFDRKRSIGAELQVEGGNVSRLWKIAFPITVGALAMSVTKLVDMTLIMRRLQDIGYTTPGANSMYGAYTTMAVPVFSLIPSLISPIALALVPKLSAAVERGSEEAETAVTNISIRLTVLLSMPAAFGVAVYSREILELIFSRETEAVTLSAPLLSVLGVSVLFSCMITTANAILQALGRVYLPIISVSVGSILKIAAAYFLIGIPEIGILGAPISTLVCDLTVTLLNVFFIVKELPNIEGVTKIYLKPLAASVAMIAVSFPIKCISESLGADRRIAFCLALISGVVVYFGAVILLGAVDGDDLLSLPFGDRIAAKMKKYGFSRSDRIKNR